MLGVSQKNKEKRNNMKDMLYNLSIVFACAAIIAPPVIWRNFLGAPETLSWEVVAAVIIPSAILIGIFVVLAEIANRKYS